MTKMYTDTICKAKANDSLRNSKQTPFLHPDPKQLCKAAAQSLKQLNMNWTLQAITLTPQKSGRKPRRNLRDPRLPSYRRSTSPLPLLRHGPPRDIPMEYSPVADAKKPTKKPPETKAKVNLLLIIISLLSNFPLLSLYNLPLLTPQQSPNLATMMAQMSRTHTPAPPKKRTPLKPSPRPAGLLIKAQKKT